jgi:ornithine cyclodeaminase/alanine dehydrogenase
MITLTSLATGELVSLLDADWITAHRTAVTAAIAVKHLARRDASRVAVIGSGTQARELLAATAQVMTMTQVEVFSPTARNREAFAGDMESALQVPVRPTGDAERAIRSADVVLSAFRAGTSPVIRADMVTPGTTICGISSVRPKNREVDTELWRRSRVVVDDLEHVRESGDGRAAAEHGLASGQDVAELWQVLQGAEQGRGADDDIVMFKSVGTAEQDIALAALVLDRARELGYGETVHGFPATRPIQSREPR